MGGAHPLPDILIRRLDDEVIAKLKVRAAKKGHSLQAEVREILDRAAERYRLEAKLAEATERWRREALARLEPDESSGSAAAGGIPMADLLVREVGDETLGALKGAARAHRRSVEAEARVKLTEVSDAPDRAHLVNEIRAFRASLEATGLDFGDSTIDIREDRDR